MSTVAAALRGAAVRAGAAIMAVRASGALGTRAKADRSPVTAADLAADAAIREGLAAAFPDIPLVTEERPETHALGLSGRAFLVDPLDGTREFLDGDGEFTVNIALINDGAPVAGVVFAPAIGRLFLAPPPGEGGPVEERADIFDAASAGPTVALRAAVADPSALRAAASRSHRGAADEAYLARLAPVAVRSAGSSLKFCLIAAGEADIYPRLGPTMHWDTAAADAVLRAAGGRVLRLSDGAPLRYADAGRRNPFFVAVGAAFDPPRS